MREHLHDDDHEGSANASTPVVPREGRGGGVLARTLHEQLIPTLARRLRSNPARVTESELALFTDELLRDDDVGLRTRVQQLVRHGVATRSLCLDLLTPAARRLGTLWEDDRCDFVQVTLALGHLHGLLRALGPQLARPATPAVPPGLRVLMAQLPQEQHVFGLSMLAHFFQAEGWSVASTAAAGGRSAASLAQASHLDVIAFSIGSEALAEGVAREIAAVRLASRNPGVVVLLGGPLVVLQPRWVQTLGADGGAAEAGDVPALAWQLVRSGQAAG